MDVYKPIHESLIIGIDFSHGPDVGVLVVGHKRLNETVEIINAFQGKEAWELYQKLITEKKRG